MTVDQLDQIVLAAAKRYDIPVRYQRHVSDGHYGVIGARRDTGHDFGFGGPLVGNDAEDIELQIDSLFGDVSGVNPWTG